MSRHSGHRRIIGILALAWAVVGFVSIGVAQDPQRTGAANWKQAYKYSAEYLRPFVYSTAVSANWIAKSDTFWYEYRTSQGKQWYKVDAKSATKEPLFDRVKVGAQLSEQLKKPLDPNQLPIINVKLNDEATKLKFETAQLLFEYDLKTDKLVKLGKAPVNQPGKMTPEQLEKLRQVLGEERFREFLEKQKDTEKKEKKDDDTFYEESYSDNELRVINDILSEDDPQQKKGGGGFKGGKGFNPNDYRVMAKDEKTFVYALNHDLYLGEVGSTVEPTRLSTDSAGEDYSFSTRTGFGTGGNLEKKTDTKDKKLRPQATWSKDSKALYAIRGDQRGVKELYLVNSMTSPRPSLLRYKYPMPGEESVFRSELHVYHMETKKLTKIERKWKDEAYTDFHFGKSGDELRFVRRDRLHRNAEFCTLNTRTGEAKCLIVEGFENANLVTFPVRNLDESDEMIWWSERSNWGHFYLYDRNGKLKNAITSGDFRASSIIAVEPKTRVVYFRANAREPGENVYHEHLYCVKLDGTGLTLMDPGKGNHTSTLSPSRQFVIDNCAGFDQEPMSVLRDARGKAIMILEKADLSKLYEVGWRMPWTFVVKAADGVTDLYGHMWKPFDFDPKKKYPVIAHVYPGPQTESMQHTFSATSTNQQLAQLGFIVVQVGNRGGSPLRSKNYQSHSYWNMRDYALADKKTALEQLAARHEWIDIERVGIYGHSGGGFLSSAALLLKPYNEFFKVAVSSAGNHDNNVYNNSWAERYHGLKEVTGKEEAKTETPPKKKGGFKGKTPPDGDDDEAQEGKKDDKDAKKDGKDEKKDDKDEKKDDKTKDKEPTRFEIKVATNAELAANLKGKLLLVHGDMDNNVHHVGTIRLADALIKANKRFDMLILPGKAHGFLDYQPYFTQRMWEYFAEHLLDDHPRSADLYDRRDRK